MFNDNQIKCILSLIKNLVSYKKLGISLDTLIMYIKGIFLWYGKQNNQLEQWEKNGYPYFGKERAF